MQCMVFSVFLTLKLPRLRNNRVVLEISDPVFLHGKVSQIAGCLAAADSKCLAAEGEQLRFYWKW